MKTCSTNWLRHQIAAITALLAISAGPVEAAANCIISNYNVVSYSHQGAYLEGTVGGNWVGFIVICGTTNGTQDCLSPATDRNLSVALTARALSRPLNLYFEHVDSCSAVANYAPVSAVTMQ